jgi:hypothetical protein
MATDLYSTVYFNDGEGLVHTDLNNQQAYLRALLQDGILQNIIAGPGYGASIYDPEFGGQHGTNRDTRWAYCLNPGQAFLRQGSANHKIQVAPGALFQKIANSAGTDATLVQFIFAGTEEWTLTDGDATNPRVDLLQMKLEYTTDTSVSRDFEDASTRLVTTTSFNKARRIQCTMNVKAGTPAASPGIPDPDSGYVAVGFCMVGNGWTTAGNVPIFGVDTVALNNLVVHDLRMPMRVKTYRTDPALYKLVTAWASSNSGSTVTSSNVTNDLYVPYNGPFGRLVGLTICAAQTPTPAHTGFKLGRSSGILSTTFTSSNNTYYNTAPAGWTEWFVNGPIFEGIGGFGGHSPAAGPTINPSGVQTYGVPLWTNGRRCLHENIRLAWAGLGLNAVSDRLSVRVQSGVNAYVLGPITFHVAEGL